MDDFGTDESSRYTYLSDKELDAMLPGLEESYKILEFPPGYAPARCVTRRELKNLVALFKSRKHRIKLLVTKSGRIKDIRAAKKSRRPISSSDHGPSAGNERAIQLSGELPISSARRYRQVQVSEVRISTSDGRPALVAVMVPEKEDCAELARRSARISSRVSRRVARTSESGGADEERVLVRQDKMFQSARSMSLGSDNEHKIAMFVKSFRNNVGWGDAKEPWPGALPASAVFLAGGIAERLPYNLSNRGD
ncbi:hypothetical protein B0T24DRAFT_587460 [Lasiosphaeria ovina]|uniref:Splicing factor 3B subunit 1 domain-containing protein n=1 Tax=Lasiosphaeria ovina TaxID=92902 RepID=A0AAE0TX35_9PEZI|nr:hypothetical protein B0T24DRAFT_587460 [Lasiosphaeria ovina]